MNDNEQIDVVKKAPAKLTGTLKSVQNLLI